MFIIMRFAHIPTVCSDKALKERKLSLLLNHWSFDFRVSLFCDHMVHTLNNNGKLYNCHAWSHMANCKIWKNALESESLRIFIDTTSRVCLLHHWPCISDTRDKHKSFDGASSKCVWVSSWSFFKSHSRHFN